jgi:hypothetical protein
MRLAARDEGAALVAAFDLAKRRSIASPKSAQLLPTARARAGW